LVAIQVEICADPPALVASRLGVSVRTLTGWRKDLRKVLSKKEFDWFNNEPSISEKSQYVLEKYQALIEKLGKEKAKNYLRINGV
jgi:hypothetical protein